jgi:hypothetical protein
MGGGIQTNYKYIRNFGSKTDGKITHGRNRHI